MLAPACVLRASGRRFAAKRYLATSTFVPDQVEDNAFECTVSRAAADDHARLIDDLERFLTNPRLGPLAVAALALVMLAGCSPAPTKDEQRARLIEQSFVGRFVGTLERRDAAGDGRVTLPARMVGKRLSDGGVELSFDLGPAASDGAAPPEREVTRLRVDGATREMVFADAAGVGTERFRIERFAAFTGLGELIITGDAVEAGQAVEVRVLYSVAPGQITWTRDVRPPGGEFKFRQRYTMRRAR